MSPKLILTLLLFTLFAALTMTACGGQAADSPIIVDASINLVDGLDRSVSLEAPAARVVSLAPSNTEILFAIGAGEQMVGRDEFSDYPSEALDLPSVGGGYGDLNTEEIVNLAPDLVLAAEINAPEQIKTLEDLGLTVYWLANPTTIEGLYENLRIVAQLTGRESEAAILIDDLSARVDAVDAALAGVERSPLVFYEIDGSDPSAPWTAGAGTFIHALITRAKGENLGGMFQDAYPQISVEELIIQNPDIILLGDSAFGVTPENVAARAGWGALSAVQNGLIFPFDDNLVSRPGPRLIDGLEALALLLHPDAFE